MLHQGEKAPEFSLPDADMEWFDFESLRGRQHAVLFFYPRDGTPYCTLEAADFSDHETTSPAGLRDPRRLARRLPVARGFSRQARPVGAPPVGRGRRSLPQVRSVPVSRAGRPQEALCHTVDIHRRQGRHCSSRPLRCATERACRRGLSTRQKASTAKESNMLIARNTVVTLKYSVATRDGASIDEGTNPLVYLHGGYGGIFDRIEEELQGKASAMRWKSSWNRRMRSANTTPTWSPSSRASCSPKTSKSACSSSAAPRMAKAKTACSPSPTSPTTRWWSMAIIRWPASR
jgi:hypothetical protein